MPKKMPAGDYLPANSPFVQTVQTTQGDRQPMAAYESDRHVPFCITERLTCEQCAALLDQDSEIATFTARVPLKVVVKGHRAIVNHIERTAFAFDVSLSNCEFRPVGAVISEFREEFAGDVLL